MVCLGDGDKQTAMAKTVGLPVNMQHCAFLMVKYNT
jgi:hypothetical protein